MLHKTKERPTDFRAVPVRHVKVKLVKECLGYASRTVVDLPEFQAAKQIAAGTAVPWPPPTPVSEEPPRDKSMVAAMKAGKIRRK